MMEYSIVEYRERFNTDGCPECRSYKIEEYERTKSDMRYKVYVCKKCHRVIKREIKRWE